MDSTAIKLARNCLCCLAEEDLTREMTKADLENYTACSGQNFTAEQTLLVCPSCATKLERFGEFRALLIASHQTLLGRLDVDDMTVKEEFESESEPTLVYQDEPQSFSQVFVQDIRPSTVKSDSEGYTNVQLAGSCSDEADDKSREAVVTTHKQEQPLLNIDVENIQAHFMCFYCDAVISTHALYVKHREEHMADRSSHRLERKCTLCGDYVTGYFTHIEEKHRDYKPYVCLICPRGKYQSANDLKHHLVTHTQVAPLRCLSCNKDFRSQSQLRWHIATESHSKALYNCPYCGLGFKQFVQLNAHFVEHEKITTVKKLFPCFSCKKIYVVKKYFLAHECMKKTAVRKKTGVHKCERCLTGFDNEDEFLCHQLTVCEEPPKFVCPTCSKEFNTRRSLSRHKAVHVAKSRIFICDLCGVATVSEFKLKLHKISHKQDRPFACQKCPATFKTEQHLKNHQDFHKDRQFECELCGKKFRFHHTIRTHMATHVGKTCTSELRQFSCDFCDRSFVRARDRERHLKMHTDDRPVKCSSCSREFRDNGGLNEHYRRVHEGIYYECHLCGKRYAQRLKLKDHLFVHRGFNPYHCTDCPQQFVKKWLYKRHLLIHNIAYVEKVHGYRETEDLREILAASIRIPARNNEEPVLQK